MRTVLTIKTVNPPEVAFWTITRHHLLVPGTSFAFGSVIAVSKSGVLNSAEPALVGE